MENYPMKILQRSGLSTNYILAILFAVIGLCFFFVPKQTLVDIGTLISPTHTLEDKTLLLFDLLKIVLPLLSGAYFVWAICPMPIRHKIQSYLSHVAVHSWMLPTILIIAFMFRLGWIIIFPTQPYADSEWYFRNASEMSAGYGFVYDLESHKPLAAWPIGYPFFLSLLFRITGPAEWVAKVANVILSVFCVALTYWLAKRVFGICVAVMAAFILALLPGMVVYSSLISTDLLFMTLVTACFAATLYFPEAVAPPKISVAIGMINGVLSLVRATGLTLIPVWGMLCWLNMRGKFPIWRCLLFITLGTLAIVMPWTMRNYMYFGRIILVSTNGGPNFWIGNNPLAYGGYIFPNDESNPLYPLIGNELEIERKGYELGLEFIRENPVRALKLLPAKIFYLYNSNDFGLHWNKLSALKPEHPGSGMLAFALTNLIYVIIWIFAILGILSLLEKRGQNRLVYSGVLLGVYWTVVHLPYFGQDRFAMPLLPILATYAAVGIATLGALPSLLPNSNRDSTGSPT